MGGVEYVFQKIAKENNISKLYKGVANGFDFMEMKIIIKNKRKIIITSTTNTKFEEMNVFLRQRIEKK